MVSKCVKTAASKLFEKRPLNSVIVRTSAVFDATLIHAKNENDEEPDTPVIHARYNHWKHRW